MSNGGRPRIIETPEEMEERVEAYFDFVKAKKEPPTITGLALFLGFASRQSFYDYETKKEGFAYTIKRARSRIEECYEKALHSRNPIGAIFALKNFGWTDKTEVTATNFNTDVTVEPTAEEAQRIKDALLKSI